MIHNKYPFNGRTFPELYNNIQNSELEYDSSLEPSLLELLKGILEKDPDKRYSIKQIKTNEWVTRNGADPVEDLNESEQIDLCQNDYEKAFGKISIHKQRKIRIQTNK